MPDKHARLSASASHRWINCPGSVHLSEQCPPPETKTYAEEGTLAHAIGELKIRYALGQMSKAKYSKGLKSLEADPMFCGEMDEATTLYANTVYEAYIEVKSKDKSAECMVEQQLDLSRWVPESFGTSDAVIIGDGCVQVIDLKYGKGVKVDAPGNPQLRLYGLGALDLFEGIYDFDKVRMTIIQPRLDHVSTEELTVNEIKLWADDVVVPRAQMAMDNTDYTAAGEWCRWCPAKAICRKRAESMMSIAKYDFEDPAFLTDEEIGEVLEKADALKTWAAEVKDYAKEKALEGRDFKGWKLVRGRSNRKYADEIEVVKALTTAGYDEAILYEKKLYGITAMEKIVGKKKLTEVLGDLIIKPDGEPTLVPVTDKREAINSAEDARKDFE